jgi:hypothetical protein
VDGPSYDLFICHAGEDKTSFVAPLAHALSAFGVSVWYDEFSLSLGDSLSRKIDEGLAHSHYGLVVLSPAFFAKHWPEYELRGLTARESLGKKVILPIWLNVSREDVIRFSPPLADKIAISSQLGSPTKIAAGIIEVIRPDLFTKIHRRLLFRLTVKRAEVQMVEAKEIRPAPIRHETFPDELLGRIRLIRAALLGPYPHSMEFWLDGFKRDAHPSSEIVLWEHVAAVYLEYVSMTRLKPHQHEAVFKLIWKLKEGTDESKTSTIAADLPEGALETIRKLTKFKLPYLDFDEPMNWLESEPSRSEGATGLDDSELESFPNDVPEHLIRELVEEIEKEERASSPGKHLNERTEDGPS